MFFTEDYFLLPFRKGKVRIRILILVLKIEVIQLGQAALGFHCRLILMEVSPFLQSEPWVTAYNKEKLFLFWEFQREDQSLLGTAYHSALKYWGAYAEICSTHPSHTPHQVSSKPTLSCSLCKNESVTWHELPALLFYSRLLGQLSPSNKPNYRKHRKLEAIQTRSDVLYLWRQCAIEVPNFIVFLNLVIALRTF